MYKRFIGIVQLSPFSTEEIKNLILSRHNSSGLHFRWNGKEERKLSELKKAELFDSYFTFSEGNPGVVLNAWISNIQRVSGSTLDVRMPEMPGLSALRRLDDDWLVLLTHFALHKRLGAGRLERITGLEESESDKMLRQMRQSGLIEEQGRGIFTMNGYLEPLLIKVLSEKQLL
jgi:CheY-like chemotaxis protein